MKNSLIYFKKLFKVLIWPIIFIIGQFFIQYIFVAIFNSKEKGIMKDSEFLEFIKTLEYQEKLNNFIDKNTILIVIMTLVIFVPIFYKVYKKYKKENKFNLSGVFISILLGISVCLTYNISLYLINNMFYFTNQFELSRLPIIVQIISSGICGPIIEELIFRGIVYNKIKEFNKNNTAIILTSVIFGLIHGNIINSIYAFLVSFILIKLYDKYKSLKAPILMHIFLNMTIIIFLPLITQNLLIINLYFIFISILIFIILNLKLNKY